MPDRDIVVIGASAGGVETLRSLASGLPKNLPAALFVVVHVPAQSRSVLPDILTRSGPLPALHPKDGDAIVPGHIYVAPPDHHLVVERGHVHLSCGPKEQHHRPCINVTFRSAATAFGPRVIGIVLSGELDDGTAGLWEIKRRGGVAVVQHPEEASYPSMPLSALREVEANHTVRVGEMGSLLARLVSVNTTPAVASNSARSGNGGMERELTDLTCPDCHGTIWEVRRGPFKDYECRAGHAYSTQTMLAQHFAAQENALYTAWVSLSEGASLAERVADQLNAEQAERLREEARKRKAQAEIIQGILRENPTFTLD